MFDAAKRHPNAAMNAAISEGKIASKRWNATTYWK